MGKKHLPCLGGGGERHREHLPDADLGKKKETASNRASTQKRRQTAFYVINSGASFPFKDRGASKVLSEKFQSRS